MKIARTLMSSLAAVLVVGAIASAAPHLGAHGPRSATEPTEAPERTDAPDHTHSAGPAASTNETGGAPDFSACAGLIGLENAICRHKALVALHSDNKGLQNALTHLQANLANHQSGLHGQSGITHGQSGEPHGQSGESHGHIGS